MILVLITMKKKIRRSCTRNRKKYIGDLLQIFSSMVKINSLDFWKIFWIEKLIFTVSLVFKKRSFEAEK